MSQMRACDRRPWLGDPQPVPLLGRWCCRVGREEGQPPGGAPAPLQKTGAAGSWRMMCAPTRPSHSARLPRAAARRAGRSARPAAPIIARTCFGSPSSASAQAGRRRGRGCGAVCANGASAAGAGAARGQAHKRHLPRPAPAFLQLLPRPLVIRLRRLPTLAAALLVNGRVAWPAGGQPRGSHVSPHGGNPAQSQHQ